MMIKINKDIRLIESELKFKGMHHFIIRLFRLKTVRAYAVRFVFKQSS